MQVLTRLLTAGVILGLVPGLGAQQTARQSRTFESLLNTPIGALPPLYASAGIGSVTAHSGIALRYGRYTPFGTNVGIDNIGLTADLGAHLSDKTQIPAGWKGCGGCDATWMGSIDFYAEMWRATFDSKAHNNFTAGLRPSLGLAHTSGHSPWFFSGALELPISVEKSLGKDMHIEPFVSPGLGYGYLTSSGHSLGGSMLPMVGGGIGVYGNAGLGVHAGVQKIFVDASTTQWGIGVSWRGPWQ